jgi:cytosine deaminase
MGGAMVFPAFVDMHTHLDKGHIWPRSPNPDGSFMGALTTVRADSAAAGARRTCARACRSRCAPPMPTAPARSARISIQHGAAGRHHLASLPGASGGLGRPDRLQAVCLIGCDKWTDETGHFGHTADLVAETKGGVLGMVTYPMPTCATG